MSKTPDDLTVGSIFETNGWGTCAVIEYRSSCDVLVRFADTGFTTSCRASALRRGSVKDRMRPTIYNKGYIGTGSHSSKDGGKLSTCYTTWHSMLERCYDEKSLDKFPTYRDCYVVDDWLCFQTFADWFHTTYPGPGYSLDKDASIEGNRVYGPDGCSWVTIADNTKHMTGKFNRSWIFRRADGRLLEVNNLNEFARLHNRPTGAFRNIVGKPTHQCDGWYWVETVDA